MSILVTGAAGFIGSQVCRQLLALNHAVIGVDNFNPDYDVQLKHDRLALLPADRFSFATADVTDIVAMAEIFERENIEQVIHLAAVAGLQNSSAQAQTIMHNNVMGFSHIIEQCRLHQVQHLVYASTAAVYGDNTDFPVTEQSSSDQPISLYAASKKANEVLAHSYAHLYQLPATGLRFFTVYGPWGRPDMALYKFTEKLEKGQAIDIHNHGQHSRDMIYIDDLVAAILKVIDCPPSTNKLGTPHQIYNLGGQQAIALMDVVETLEQTLGKTTEHVLLPLQAGEIKHNQADASAFQIQFDWQPAVSFQQGVKNFIAWYRQYHHEDVG